MRRLIEYWRRLDAARFAFLASIAFGVFLLGGLFATLELQPYQAFEEGYKAARRFYREHTQTRPDIIEPIVYAGDGVTLHHEDATWRGLTLMQGIFPEGVELRLVDMAGTVIHRWPADFDAVWPDPAHVFPQANVPMDALHYHTQGM